MNLTKKQLYKIIYDLKLQRNIYPDVNRVVEVVAEKLNINPDEKLKNELKKHLCAFKKLNEANRHISFEEKLNKLVFLIVLDSEHFSVKSSPEPEIRKIFTNVGRETRLARTQQLVDDF